MQLLTQGGSLVLLTRAAAKSLSYPDQSLMPKDYGTRLSAAEVADLVKFLNSLTKADLKPDRNEEQDDGE